VRGIRSARAMTGRALRYRQCSQCGTASASSLGGARAARAGRVGHNSRRAMTGAGFPKRADPTDPPRGLWIHPFGHGRNERCGIRCRVGTYRLALCRIRLLHAGFHGVGRDMSAGEKTWVASPKPLTRKASDLCPTEGCLPCHAVSIPSILAFIECPGHGHRRSHVGRGTERVRKTAETNRGEARGGKPGEKQRKANLGRPAAASQSVAQSRTARDAKSLRTHGHGQSRAEDGRVGGR
jgi:hypothetical protein